MSKVKEGKLIVQKEHKFGIIVSRFNVFITNKMLEGALDTLKRHGADDNKIEIVWVPGGFEIPYAANKLALSKKFNAIICLASIIKGATPHFDFISNELAKGIAQISLKTGVPVIFGVITADTLEQAIERAGTKLGNKGSDAASAAIEMANLFEII